MAASERLWPLVAVVERAARRGLARTGGTACNQLIEGVGWHFKEVVSCIITGTCIQSHTARLERGREAQHREYQLSSQDRTLDEIVPGSQQGQVSHVR